ncbi:hypothetical protein [Enterococcus faecalis]|uniref:AbiTii domain-containing protein n=1 Tax=Enterococcus faecalis TaxID=1351 RepID=UPI000330375A|nr:hypothetical protein [Enterococcus faecalis]MDQ8288450.1 hypothetical protein [Enterococcus faecium]EGO2738434.1 hypothetical protein [Enterococcus faecalis]EIW9708029.1 hypothetical protein [Enterococcus faecalis]EIX2433304.1 hypothetical protein [Enterococcus faecalis]EJM6507565.1 hypothetical protein [Enterococcus faecalis]
MAKSQLIKDIATNNISLEEALQRLLLITSELDDLDISNWILSELNGYNSEDIIPEYRKNISYRLIYSGINGNFQITNQPLPLHYFSEKIRTCFSDITVKESIKSIESIVEKGEKVGMDLTSLAFDIYENTGIKCSKIFQEYNKISLEHILSNIKSKLILFLIDLEKQFGNLDNLDIEENQLTVDKKEAASNSFSEIVYDGKVANNEL